MRRSAPRLRLAAGLFTVLWLLVLALCMPVVASAGSAGATGENPTAIDWRLSPVRETSVADVHVQASRLLG